MELPKEEYIKVEKDGQIYTCCTMRQKALHTIGLNHKIFWNKHWKWKKQI